MAAAFRRCCQNNSPGPDLVGKAQYDSAKSPAKRLDNEGTFASGEHNPTHGDDILCAHRITDDGKRVFSDLAAWRDIIRRTPCAFIGINFSFRFARQSKIHKLRLVVGIE